MGKRNVCVGLVLFATATPLAAQSTTSSPTPHSEAPVFVEPLSVEQDGELDRWLDEMQAWQRYDAKYFNRPARDAIGRIVPRRPRPAAPVWLGAYCASAKKAGIVDLEARTARACQLLEDPRASADPTTRAIRAARDAAEAPDRYSSFLRRLHLDGLGVTTSSGPRAYGIVGSHITLVDVGRVQVFGPPGVLLLSVPDAGGSRRITLGYTWGLSVRLTDVRLSGPTRNMTLFLTVSKLWVNGGVQTGTHTGGLQIVGLSLAPRRWR